MHSMLVRELDGILGKTSFYPIMDRNAYTVLLKCTRVKIRYRFCSPSTHIVPDRSVKKELFLVLLHCYLQKALELQSH